MADYKFPTEMVDLPSKGYFYVEGHPLSKGKVEVKYMTAKEEDILTSQNLIKQGLVIDTLLQALIVDKKIDDNDLLFGDKVEEWTLKGAMIQSANFGDLDWAANEPNDITLTLRYDYAILQF